MALASARGIEGDPHVRLDAIRLRSHRLIAQKIDGDSSLLDVPARNIRRGQAQWGYLHPAYAEWLGILAQPWPEIRALLVADDDYAKRLRQSTPFTGILSPWERKAIHDAITA